MGRELRRVPVGFDFPKNDRGEVQSHYDETFADACAEWLAGLDAWRKGERPKYSGDDPDEQFWESWGNPPQREFYRPAWPEGVELGWCVYQTVSEGTPVTPVFATQQGLIEYLVANGDYWDQKRRAEGNSIMDCRPWSREVAEKFVLGNGWAPSFVMDASGFHRGQDVL